MKAKQFWKRGVALAVAAVTLFGTAMPMQADAAWRQDDAKWWWQRDDGSYPASSWESINGTWYYFDETGYMATGWQFVNGAWYYLGEPGDGAMKTGWQFINGAWYYLGGSGDGAMKTGWQQVGDTWYYLYDDGRMAADTVIDGYYLDGSGAWVQDANQGQTGGSSVSEGWVQSGGLWWYQNADGSYPANCWKQIGGTWYYFDASGWMATGWQQIGGDWYYLGEAGDGAMRSSQWVGNYYVKEDGRMATNQWIGEYYVGADGAWIPGASANNSQQNEGDTGSSTGNSQQNGNQSNNNSNGNAQGQVTIKEQLLLDQGGVKITAISLSENGGRLELRVLIENNTSKDIAVQIRDGSINGYMVDSVFSSNVTAGHKAYDEITYYKTSLENAGIDVVKSIEFSFHVFTWTPHETLFNSDKITIYTSAADQNEQYVEPETQPDTQAKVIEVEVGEGGAVAVNQNGIVITVLGIEKNIAFTNVKVRIENNSQQDVTIQTRTGAADELSAYINGHYYKDLIPVMSSDVFAGEVVMDEIMFLNYDLNTYSIDSIDDLEIKFHVFEYGFGDTIFDTDLIHLHFQH